MIGTGNIEGEMVATEIVTMPYPQATIYPVGEYQDYVMEMLNLWQQADILSNGHRRILDADMDSLRLDMPHINWFRVAELSYALQQRHKAMNRELCSKVALMWMLERTGASTSLQSADPLITPSPQMLVPRKA